ncbi:MAG: ABC transporter ATP-binding protein, partial [Gammaproteobacteria bacterium]|nr:ABC transporter ATP-binding protein [Gammaproteobacteria bacterium]
ASLSVDHNETLAIVGESGSGKSVLCYSLLNLIPQPPGRIESGSALFQGRDLLQMDTAALRRIRGRDIAMIFQDPMTSLNPFLTIGEQLMEPLVYHHSSSRARAKRRALEVLHEVGIPEPEQRFGNYPHEFSGGMRQRVMIAMALITEPKLLIADEPTTALDVTIQAQILELIADLQRRHQIAVIFISHDLAVVSDIADNVVVMEQGRIVEQGSRDHIFHHSRHDYTRKLLASVPEGAKQSTSMAGEQPLLRVSGLKTYFAAAGRSLLRPAAPATRAVDDVDLTIQRGEVMGLVGESGSGKSTLGRAILRLVPV